MPADLKCRKCQPVAQVFERLAPLKAKTNLGAVEIREGQEGQANEGALST